MDADPFRDLLARLRRGDADAAYQFVREYEPVVLRKIRLHLTDPTLRRAFDSGDICQSVLANFFIRFAAGQFDLESPRQLIRLLQTMARNRLRDRARRARPSEPGAGLRGRRGGRRRLPA